MCVLFGACKANAVAATSRGNVGGVRADGDHAVLDAGQTVLACGVAIDVIYVSVGWIVFLESRLDIYIVGSLVESIQYQK